jgi:hypothetical protein
MTENCKFRKAILSAFYNILQRNFGILLILWCSFKLWWNFCLELLSSKFWLIGEWSIVKHPTPLDEHQHTCGADTFMKGTLESLPKFSGKWGNVLTMTFIWPSLCHRAYKQRHTRETILDFSTVISHRVYMNNMIHLPPIILNFIDFFYCLGRKEILWKKEILEIDRLWMILDISRFSRPGN